VNDDKLSPVVSVVIPAYNAGSSIGATLQSIFDQSVQPAEIVVVDDGSQDDTVSVLQSYGDRIRYIRQDNAGSSAARNRGIVEACGNWIAFLDADDRWSDRKLERQLELLAAHPELAWLAGAYQNISEANEVSIPRTKDLDEYVVDDVVDDALRIMGAGWSIWTGTVMVRRDVFDVVGDFDVAQRTSHDLDLWLRIAEKYPQLGWIRDPIAEYAINPVGLTMTSIASTDESLIELYRRALEAVERLPAERRQYVHDFATWHSGKLLRDSLGRGNHQQAKWLVRQFQTLGIEVPRVMAIAVRLPKFVLPLYRRMAALARRSKRAVL